MPASPRTRRLRWLAPIAVFAAIGLLALLPTLSSAATPDLPAISPEQLVAKVKQSNVQAFSGTFQVTTDLGIPNLSALQGATQTSGNGFNPTDLLSGTHTATIAADGPDRQRLSMPGSLNEVDAFHDGTNAWLWQSDGHQVTHYILPAHTPEADANKPDAEPAAPTPAPTPEDMAKKLLDQITPSTNVSVTTPAYVADKAVYELVLAPHAADSTIDHVGIAVDAANGMPLEVTVVPKGQTKPAVQLGFTSIDYGKPGGSFSFTPPPGSTVKTNDLTKPNANENAGPTPNQPVLPAYAMHRRHHGQSVEPPDGQVVAPPATGAAPTATPPPGGKDTTVVGQDWTSVVIARQFQLPIQGFGIREATTPVSGAWGSGRILHTALANVLFLSDGRVAAGFVTPSALEAAVAHG
jgi:outer membrane lipoprotein-sorting protein